MVLVVGFMFKKTIGELSVSIAKKFREQIDDDKKYSESNPAYSSCFYKDLPFDDLKSLFIKTKANIFVSYA